MMRMCSKELIMLILSPGHLYFLELFLTLGDVLLVLRKSPILCLYSSVEIVIVVAGCCCCFRAGGREKNHEHCEQTDHKLADVL